MATIYEQLGGSEAMDTAVDTAVDIFYRKVFADSRIFKFFEGVEMEGATDATGSARLVLPDQQDFHLQLDDPNGA